MEANQQHTGNEPTAEKKTWQTPDVRKLSTTATLGANGTRPAEGSNYSQTMS